MLRIPSSITVPPEYKTISNDQMSVPNALNIPDSNLILYKHIVLDNL